MPYRLANVAGRAALVRGDHYFDLDTITDGGFDGDPMNAIARPDELADLSSSLDSHEPTGLLDEVDLLAPVPRPTNVFALGLNYADHAEESGFEIPGTPLVFGKFPGSVAGPGTPIVVPGGTIDYEAEVVVVIGTSGANITREMAWEHGYSPIGPVLVSSDALDDRGAIGIECLVNGETRQQGSTADLIFDVPTIIEYLSSILTLHTGDLIFTGTPDGVGMATGRMLQPGDIVETRVEGVGSLMNQCVGN
jgi:2,4-diketo-3-deoxy-L-fuconate hydrolase